MFQFSFIVLYQVILGYVCNCDVRRTNGTLGFRIVVESQYPLQLVHDTVEEAIEVVGEWLEQSQDTKKTVCSANGLLLEEEEKPGIDDFIAI